MSLPEGYTIGEVVGNFGVSLGDSEDESEEKLKRALSDSEDSDAKRAKIVDETAMTAEERIGRRLREIQLLQRQQKHNRNEFMNKQEEIELEITERYREIETLKSELAPL